jgi:chemotaxis protein MotB
VAELEQRDQDIGALRDRRAELEAQLADEQERTLLAQKEVEAREVRVSELLDLYADVERDLEAERELSAGAQRQVALLNQQIAALRVQLTRIEAALQASEAQAKEQKVVIADLGRRLNLALASKVEELARYRSEFFGRLREVLGDRRYIRIVGDRFVFQSEVLFDSGSAELNEEGKLQLAVLAETLLRIARQIPPELEWILRVDGHTDKIPIATARYPSNWELSAARALSVAHFFIDQGVPPERLAAAGFGEFQPIDKRNDEIALRRNRRIELKLDQR